jgi:peptidylprolyl isomerase
VVAPGDTISVHYTGKIEGGDVFDSSEGRSPLMFTVGAGQLIRGFDSAVVDMVPGERKTVTIPPEEGYGERREDHVVDFPRANIPQDMQLEVGMIVQMSDQSGRPIPVIVTEILDNVVRMDVNHPLAGKTLVFDIEIVETGLQPDCQTCSGNCSGCGE